MELMASESSVLDVLSMQHVSIHTHLIVSSRACRQHPTTLAKPFFRSRSGDCMSWNVTSSGPHVCDRIA